MKSYIVLLVNFLSTNVSKRIFTGKIDTKRMILKTYITFLSSSFLRLFYILTITLQSHSISHLHIQFQNPFRQFFFAETCAFFWPEL